MSFADHAVLWLHVIAAVFTIGPVTAAIMATPRYVRKRNTAVVGYLFRTTRLYSIAALLTLIFGIVLTAMTHRFSQWWISVSLTLFVVAFVLLVLVMRDQRKAFAALEAADRGRDAVAVSSKALARSGPQQAEEEAEAGAAGGGQPATTATAELRVAAVERGRIASIGGLTALIWLVILVLMVWH
jgi:hypothetical protein